MCASHGRCKRPGLESLFLGTVIPHCLGPAKTLGRMGWPLMRLFFWPWLGPQRGQAEHRGVLRWRWAHVAQGCSSALTCAGCQPSLRAHSHGTPDAGGGGPCGEGSKMTHGQWGLLGLCPEVGRKAGRPGVLPLCSGKGPSCGRIPRNGRVLPKTLVISAKF